MSRKDVKEGHQGRILKKNVPQEDVQDDIKEGCPGWTSRKNVGRTSRKDVKEGHPGNQGEQI
jgi:hypothetical protein